MEVATGILSYRLDFTPQDSGSTSIVATDTGVKYSESHYKPFSETRLTNPLGMKYTLTAQLSHTDDFGLLFFNALWVDPQLARFAQADTIVPDAYNPQDYNRYAYVRSNPLRYVDLSGHEICNIDGLSPNGEIPPTFANPPTGSASRACTQAPGRAKEK